MDKAIKIIDKKFQSLVFGNALLEHLWTGGRWCEGPVYFADGDYLLWSDIPNNRIMRWTESGGASVFRQPSNHSNGNTRDRQGRLISCQHKTRSVTRTEWNGEITTIADQYQGKRLNSPNDVVVKSDGSVWFSDPTYGILADYEGDKSEPELDDCYVFRVDPQTGKTEIAADDFFKPNGLAFSPDESKLYIADTGVTHDEKGPYHIRVFQVKNNKLSGGEVFAECTAGIFDGFCVDIAGNIWSSAEDGVHCYSPNGKLLGKIFIPETVSNCTFGSIKKNRLFITTQTSIYSIFLNTRGAQQP